MSMVVAFDTLKYANEIKKAGLTPEQAEIQTRALASVMNDLVEGALATKDNIADVKHDITEVKQELKQDISEVRQEIADLRHETIRLDSKIDTVIWKLTVRLGGITTAGVGILAALMVILHLT